MGSTRHFRMILPFNPYQVPTNPTKPGLRMRRAAPERRADTGAMSAGEPLCRVDTGSFRSSGSGSSRSSAKHQAAWHTDTWDGDGT